MALPNRPTFLYAYVIYRSCSIILFLSVCLCLSVSLSVDSINSTRIKVEQSLYSQFKIDFVLKSQNNTQLLTRSIDRSINQSINQNLYSAPSRSLGLLKSIL